MHPQQQLYNHSSLACSKLVTRAYSTSFSKGIRCLARPLRDPVYAIYGFVRFADEIVDTFEAVDRTQLLNRFRQDTWLALEERISLNPILHAFQETVHRYQIPRAYIEAFLHSMEMDLSYTRFNQQEYETYIYGSAEVVGLMCLCVFCEGDPRCYEPLVPSARALGSAFQKINFLRDLKADWEERGRVYFPGVEFSLFSEADKQAIEADLAADFREGAAGIAQLPTGARLGVDLAYRYYLRLFNKIRHLSARRLTQGRVRVSDSRKFSIFLTTYWQHARSR